MAHLTCDVAVIGAGTAGLAAERAARASGATTLLIDEAFAGTMCATVGCMPSKLMIAAARAAESVRSAGEFGIACDGVTVDGRAVMRRLRAERDRFVAATRQSIAELPEGTCLKARARFTGPNALALDDGSRLTARAVVVATGSEPTVPEPFRALGSLALTNRTIFELGDLPESLAVVGAGPIGVELAQAMARLGVAVTLFDAGERLGGIRDDAVHAALGKVLGRDLALHLGVDVEPCAQDDGVRLAWSGNSSGSAHYSAVLLATGRPPALAGLCLEAAGLACDEHGVPKFDRRTMQCGDAPVFIAGDVDADVPVLHEASHEGAIAGRNAANYPQIEAADRMVPFSLIFSEPPVASVGRAPETDSRTGCVDFGEQGRARVDGTAEGVLRLHADPDGTLTGADLCAPGGEHLAHLIAWAIARGETASGLLSMPFYHPTLEEALKTALQELCRTLDAPLALGQELGGASRY